MEILSISLNLLIIMCVFRLTKEVKLTKCAIRRFEMLRKYLYSAQKEAARNDGSVELMEIK